MQRSKWLNSLVALFVVFLSFSAVIGEFDSEKDLIKAADKHFEAGDYNDCLSLYEGLVSNHPQDPNYNYRYGVCLLYASEDKVQALRYLSFSVKKEDKVDSKAFYFYGIALQQNYEFESASNQFKKFQSLVKPKEAEELKVAQLIKQCKTARSLISDFKKMDVVTKKSVGKKEFFRSYRLGSMKRSIIITPEEFMNSQDKKSKDYSLIVHNPMNLEIFFSSYNKEGSVGGKDIFKVLKMPDGTFSKPVNLGPLVNTPMDEDYPYLHPNGRILYFASKGRNSIGGYDIFKSELDTNTNLWGRAQNVGFSINSPADDILYVSDMEENIAYFASARGDKQGKITVYKILPNKSSTPIVIVRGQVEIEGSPNNSAKISVYNKKGEEIGVYNSKQSGTFIMTLDEDQTYKIGVSAPGRGEAKSVLEVPAKSISSMLSKKFTVSAGKLLVDEGDELLATAEAKNKLLAETAQLNVNQSEDVDFNTEIVRPETSAPNSVIDEENKELTEVNSVDEIVEEAKEVSQGESILAGAEEELAEVTASKEKVEKQIDATYHVANKKKIKADLIKDDIETISEELESAFTEEQKEELKEQLNNKRTELKANAASATAALELAKSKERELAVKNKQEELAKTYVEAVKKANTSNNSSSAIAQLEKARDELDRIEEEIRAVKKKDGSAETFAKADEAKKKVADLELKQMTLDGDVDDIIAQKQNLEKQIKATKNKGLKEEFGLQVKELEEELAEVKVESNVNQAKLDEAKSTYEVLSSTQNIYDEIYTEAEDESLVSISESQKVAIQRDVKTQSSKVESVLKESELEEVTQIDKTSDVSVEEIQKENEELDAAAQITPERQYEDEVAKANLEKQSLQSINDEIELLTTALSGTEDKRQQDELEEKIADLKLDKKVSIKRLKQYVEKAKTQQEELPAEVASSVEKENELLSALTQEVEQIEEEIKAEEIAKENKTEPIDFDIETATETEIDALLSENVKIRENEFELNSDNEEVQKLLFKVDENKKQAVQLLLDANKEQVEYEASGNKGVSPKAEKLKQQAIEKQFEIAKTKGEANEQQYINERDDLEKAMFSQSGVATETLKEKSKEVSNKWISASVRREQANSSKNENEKIRLINEASELENEALAQQAELKKAIDEQVEEVTAIAEEQKRLKETGNKEALATAKLTEEDSVIATKEQSEIKQETILAEGEKEVELQTEQTDNKEEEVVLPEIVQVGQPDGDSEKSTIATVSSASKLETNEIKPVSHEDFNKDNPSEMAVKYANQEGYGIERKEDFTYSGASSVRMAQEQAEQEEKEALDYFYQAQKLKEEAENNPDKAKKLEKEADKLLAKGAKAQDKANEKYAALNEKEIEFNAEEIKYSIENDAVVKKDSAKIILNQVDEIYAEAKSLRKEAGKAKTADKKADLINEAYSLELEAIKKQNYILSGALDGDDSDIYEEVSFTVPVRDDNEYTRKADALRTQADKEQDPEKKRELFEKARMNELAGNKGRTQRLLKELDADKTTFEANKQIVITSREQSNNNTPANKAWKYEMEADSLFELGVALSEKAEKNTDEVERLKQITQSNEFLSESKEIQASAIRKYQESKAAPDEEGFVSDFRKENVAEELAQKDKKDIGNAVESEELSNAVIKDELTTAEVEVAVEPSQSIETTAENIDTTPEKEAFVDETEEQENTQIETSELEEVDNTQESELANIEQEEVIEDKPIQEITEIKTDKGSPESAEEAYKALIADADKTEAQESERVQRIIHLKNQAGINRNKSEEFLAQVDGLSNETEIMEKLNEANRYRALAEEQEVEAKNQELILKNNVAESRAQRKEAEMVLAGIEESEQADVIAAAQNDNEELKTVRAFLENGSGEKEEVVKTVSNPVDTEPVDEVVEYETPITSSVETETFETPIEEVTQTSSGSSEFSFIDMDNISLLDEGGTENSVEDEFVMDQSKVYTSSDEIPLDPQMPDGIIYQVQVGAFREKINPAIFNGLSPLVGEKIPSGIIRYKVGYFRGFKSANMAKGRIRKLGYPDAFVVVFYNGQRITLDKADEVIDAADEGEKFVYENLVQDEVQELVKMGISEEEAFEDPIVSTSTPSVVVQGAAAQDNGLQNDLLKIGGLFYTVQVGVFSSPRISADLSGVKPLYTEKTSNGYLRYTTGVYRDFGSADNRKEEVRTQGVKDAFVTAYKDNQRISAAQAKASEGGDNNASANSGSNKQGNSSSDNAEVVFKVQVGAYRALINVESTPVFKDLTAYEISNIKTSSGLLIYMVGNYKTKADADSLRQIVINAGGADCFVVALVDGERISMTKALQMVK